MKKTPPVSGREINRGDQQGHRRQAQRRPNEQLPPRLLDDDCESIGYSPVTLFDELKGAGVWLPSPDRLSDQQIRHQLRIILETLADRGVFIRNLDSIKIRSLYQALWSDILHDRRMIRGDGKELSCVIELIPERGPQERIAALYCHLYEDS